MKLDDSMAEQSDATLRKALLEDDLKGYMQALATHYPREYITIDDQLSGDWQLAAVSSALEQRLRIPLIEYSNVANTSFSVVHNVCSSLARIARVLQCSVPELEQRLGKAYDSLIPPEVQQTGPVRQVLYQGDAVDLSLLPAIRYTQTQTHPYISAACVVARDVRSGALNVSFNRLMIQSRNTLGIYMTPGSDLETIYRENQQSGLDTPVIAYLGSHPLWSLGSLASGPLALDEFSVIGGLLGYALPVVRGLHDPDLLLPAKAQISLEGVLKCDLSNDEGPYGEAFGYVSAVATRPVIQVQSFSHQHQAMFQDIVPGKIEHMTMTSVAIKVHLKKILGEQFDCFSDVFLPAPMTAYIAVENATPRDEIHRLLRTVLFEQKFIKHAVVFDSQIKLDNAKATQRAQSIHVQADRDVLIFKDQSGNGLDPSEQAGRTTKWGIDATATTVAEGLATTNELPEEVVKDLDIEAIWRCKRVQDVSGDGRAQVGNR